MYTPKTLRVLALGLAPFSVACGQAMKTGLSVTVPQATPLASALTFGGNANDTLVLSKAELVVRELRFERVDSKADCGNTNATGENHDDCAELEVGAMIVALPLDGNVTTQLTNLIPPGKYHKLSFEVHKLQDDSQDQALLLARPDLKGVSIKVSGAYNTAAFTFTTDLTAEQEIEFNTPITIDGVKSVNVTLSIDAAKWFRDANGAIIDPNTAMKGGANEGKVKDAIRASFGGFEDDNHEGKDDHNSTQKSSLING